MHWHSHSHHYSPAHLSRHLQARYQASLQLFRSVASLPAASGAAVSASFHHQLIALRSFVIDFVDAGKSEQYSKSGVPQQIS
jgi:hypothetical protein